MTITTRDPIVTQTRDITGNVYLGLLELARHTESLVGLVWREQLKFSPSALQIAADLKPSLVEERLTDTWPGTHLFGSQAWYRLYRCDGHSLPILARARQVDGWLAPDFPEDMSCHLPTGDSWLISVAHESCCWLFPEVLGEFRANELDRLLKSV